MAGARRSAQKPPWRTGLAAALRRLARAVAPPQSAAGASVMPPAEHDEFPPQLPAPGTHTTAGNGATQPVQSTVVDPLERARAALRDARRHMTSLMDAEPPAVASVAPVPPVPSEPLHELLAELRDERRALLAEIAGMRTLLQETRTEVAALRQALRDRLAEVQALQQLPPAPREPAVAPPAPSLAELIADAGATSAAAGPSAGGAADAMTPDEPPAAADAETADQSRFERQPDWSPFRDFGWRARPEAGLSEAGVADAGHAEPDAALAAHAESPEEWAAPLDATAGSGDTPQPPQAAIDTLGDAASAEAELIVSRIADFAPIMPPAPLDEPEPQTPTPAAAQLTVLESSEAHEVAAPDEAPREAVPGDPSAQAVPVADSANGSPHADIESGRPDGHPAAAAPRDAQAIDAQAAGEAVDSGAGVDMIRLPSGSTRLVIGPVRSIGRLTALERRLVREPALTQVVLADFRRQLASILVTAREPIAFAALTPALGDEERRPVAATWQSDGALLVTLGKRSAEGA